jgi:hypothetical protein
MWKFSRREVSRISQKFSGRKFPVGKFPGFPEIIPGEIFPVGSFPDFSKVFSLRKFFYVYLILQNVVYIITGYITTPFQETYIQ